MLQLTWHDVLSPRPVPEAAAGDEARHHNHHRHGAGANDEQDLEVEKSNKNT